MKKLLISFSAIALLAACGGGAEQKKEDANTVNIYTDRHYETDDEVYKRFTKETGIKVNVIKAKADELINRIEMEGTNSPADMLITVDAGRLSKAQEKGLFQPVKSAVLEENIPSNFREPNGHWFGLSYRARVIVYNRDKVYDTSIPTYESLTDPKWKGKLLIRSSENIYNQSLVASMVAELGRDKAKEWAAGIVANMAREPKGNDRDQMKGIAAGIGDIAVVNSYYLGQMINEGDPEERKVGYAMGILFPNQEDRGTHINVSGAGVAKNAPHKDNAVKFLEFLSTPEIQQMFAKANYEYPVMEGVEKAEILTLWGDFKYDTLNLAQLGKYNKDAMMIMNEVGWK